MQSSDPNLLASWPIISEETIVRISDYLRAGNTSLDPDLFATLEADLCNTFEAKHALLTCNGTSAAFSCFHAIGLKPGDEIIAPAFTHWATALPALHLGCRIVFADLEPSSLSIDPTALPALVTPHTKAVVICHLYGNPVDICAIRAFCNNANLRLIEDISHAPGAIVQRKPVGSFGDMAFCSMQAAKTISGGEIGALLTSKFDLYERAVELGHPKRIAQLLPGRGEMESVGLGFKFRPSSLHVLLAKSALSNLDSVNRVRCEMFGRMRQNLDQNFRITFPTEVDGSRRVYWEYEMLLPGRAHVVQRVAKCLCENGFIASGSKMNLLPDLPHFQSELKSSSKFPNARRLSKELLVIRAFSRFDESVARALATALNRICGELQIL